MIEGLRFLIESFSLRFRGFNSGLMIIDILPKLTHNENLQIIIIKNYYYLYWIYFKIKYIENFQTLISSSQLTRYSFLYLIIFTHSSGP